VAFVGDVLLHDSLQIQAAEHGPDGGHHTLWHRVRDGLAAAEITYANLEGPVAEGLRCDGRLTAAPPAVSYAKGGCGPGNGDAVYTGYPLFNYPPALLDALAAAGVDVVSTANNHALDRRALGVDMTVDALAARGIAFAGTRRSDGPAALHALTEVRSPRGRMRLAWLACTYGTNGLVDGLAQVAPCYDHDGSPWPGLLAENAPSQTRHVSHYRP